VGQGLLIIEATRLHSDTPPSVELFWTSDHADAETSIPDNTQHSQDRTPIPLAGFEPANPATEPPQTHTSDRGAAGIGNFWYQKPNVDHRRQAVGLDPDAVPSISILADIFLQFIFVLSVL
jgi:hypothetical protein